ncbi:MAG TPA: 2OG-Fe(II) oxygenase [Candidatus Acidoferrales bacterium]|nr:2OG-Fe(II) oxygenase [Candidatus Acidoferrales bacterium]
MIQLTKRGVAFESEPRWIEKLQADFACRHYILLPRLIDPAILETITEQLSVGRFVPRENRGIGTEYWLPQDVSLSTLHFLMNLPEFLRWLERVTACRPIGVFWGRLYRMEPAEGHSTNWHDDVSEEDPRRLALSLNLSPEAFVGGELELRDKISRQMHCRLANRGFGDAIIFRIGDNLEHRIAPVRGAVPKIAFAGWFRPSGASFHPAHPSQAAEVAKQLVKPG